MCTLEYCIMMTQHATWDVPTLKGHVAPMKPLCGYRTFGWALSQALNSLEADLGTGHRGSNRI